MQQPVHGDDPFATFKAAQKQSWGLFAPLEAVTTMPAADLIGFARVKPDDAVLDVATGTGVVSVTAARAGARVSALDLSPVLLERARQNAATAGVEVSFSEGDVEHLPYPDASFDVVLSQFGHMFAPRAEVALDQMLRVLKPGGTIAFTTWPPEHVIGEMFALIGRYLPPPPGISPPPAWGSPHIVRERLGDRVTDLTFERGIMLFPSLSPGHFWQSMATTLGPVVKLVEQSKSEPQKLAQFRAELDQLLARYVDGNSVRQHYLMTRAKKR
jgi:SAM-dependent methyltransferase